MPEGREETVFNQLLINVVFFLLIEWYIFHLKMQDFFSVLSWNCDKAS
jgi:hypothetical protein